MPTWYHDSNLLDGLCELIWLNGAVVVKIEVLEALKKNLFFAGDAGRLLRQLLLQSLLETIGNESERDGVKLGNLM